MDLVHSGASGGMEYFADSLHLTDLVLRDKGVITDRDESAICSLPNLSYLQLVCPKITDQGFRHLGVLTKLTDLALYSSPSAAEQLLPLVYENLPRLAA